jgi:hypothetical protein
VKKVLLLLIFISGCAGSGRYIASIDNNCELEKHPQKEWYRFKMNDQLYNQHWYSKNKAQGIWDKYEKAGRCNTDNK